MNIFLSCIDKNNNVNCQVDKFLNLQNLRIKN